MRKVVKMPEVRALWFRFWPVNYPRQRVDVGQGAVRVFAAAFLVWCGWQAGPVLFGSGPSGWARAWWHLCGALVALLVAVVVDTAARDQGRRVGEWRMSEHHRLQFEDRRDGAAQRLQLAGDTSGPGSNDRAPAIRASLPAGSHHNRRRPRPAGVPESAGAVLDVADEPPVAPGPMPVGVPEGWSDHDTLTVIYAFVSGAPGSGGVGGPAIREGLAEKGIGLGRGRLTNYLWELTMLMRWLAYDPKAQAFRALPVAPDADRWPGLGLVFTRLVERAGGNGLNLAEVLGELADRGVRIPREQVMRAAQDEVRAGRLRVVERTGRYLAVTD